MAAANNANIDFDDSLEDGLEVELPSESSNNNNFPLCVNHDQELQNLFCTFCVMSVCYRCVVESHNGHSLDYYHKASAKGLAVRNALTWEMEDTINELTIGERRVYLVQKSMERKVETARKDIKGYMKKCHAALEKREQFLLRRLATAHKQKKLMLKQQQNEIKERLKSLLKCYDKLHNDFSVDDPVMQTRVNSEAMSELNEARDIQLIPATSDRVHFWRDFGMQVRMRNYLGILEVDEDLVPKQEEDGGYNSPEVSDIDLIKYFSNIITSADFWAFIFYSVLEKCATYEYTRR